MQAVGQSQEQVGTRPFLHELKWEEESGEASSALIRDLLDRGKEVFVVEECRSRGQPAPPAGTHQAEDPLLQP